MQNCASLSGYHTTALGTDISSYLNSHPLLTKQDFIRDNETRGTAFVTRKTSGSSGIPMVLTFSRQQIADQQAVRQYCYQQVGIRLGEREARFWGRKETQGLKQRIKNLILHRKLFCDMSWDEKALYRLVAYRPSYLYGYSSMLLATAKAYQKYGITPPPLKSVICTAESIAGFQITLLEQVFKAPVMVEYGCTEFDIIAMKLNGVYTIVNPNLIIEKIDSQLVITDVCHQELSRYQLGDGAAFSEKKAYYTACDNFADVNGRSQERIVYLPEGKVCHAGIFSEAMKLIHETLLPIHQFRITQKSVQQFNIEICTLDDVEPDSQRITEKIMSILDEKLGYHADYNISYGPLKKLSGKHDYFTSEMN